MKKIVSSLFNCFNLVYLEHISFFLQTSLNGFTEILEDNVLLVELFDSLGAPGMTPTSINDLLVKEGLASHEVG